MVGEPSTLFSLLVGLSLVLVVAHGLGLLADRLGSAPVVGELLTGLVLGPSVLGVLAPGVVAVVLPVPAGLAAFASVGLVLLLVLAGTEVDVSAFRQSLRPAVALATGAFVVPFLAGVALGWWLPARYLVSPAGRLPFALFLGTALSISAVPVALRVLVDLDALDLRVGQLTLTVAVAVDAVGWVALSVVAEVARGGGVDPLGVGRTVFALLGFVAVVTVLGPRLVGPLFAATERVRSPAITGFSIVVVLGLGAAAVSTALGLEPVLGAFLAGALARNRLGAEAERVFHVATLGLFAPLFFATAGLRADLGGILTPRAALVAGVALLVAILGKFLGVALGAAFTDLSNTETVCLAIGLNARGAMEIVVAALGLAIGVFTPVVYAVVVLVAIVTSVMPPPRLWRALTRLPSESTVAV